MSIERELYRKFMSESKEDVDKIYKSFNSKMTQNQSKELVKSIEKEIKADQEKIAKKPNKSAEKRIARNKDFIAAHKKFQKSGKEHPFDESANEASYDKYYVCHTPFKVGMGAWSWRVKVNDIFKIDQKDNWWIYSREAGKFIPKYAYNGAEIQFDVSNYGSRFNQDEFMAAFKQNCKLYIGSAIDKVLDQIKQENEFTGTKSEIIGYLENQDEKAKFLIRKISNESLESNESADKDLFQLLDELEKIITSDPSKSLEILKDIEILLKNDQGEKSNKNSMNESRNWTVVVKCSGPDNMNNIEIEDKIEELLDRAGLTAISVDATRGE